MKKLSSQKKIKNYEEILELFVGNDELRPQMNTPFEIDNYVYSTDAHTLIRVKKELVKQDYSSNKTISSAENFIAKKYPCSISVEELKGHISEIPLIDEVEFIDNSVECNECNGCGEVEWEYENYTKDDNCPKCDGSGRVGARKEVKTGNKILDPDYKLEIQSRKYSVIFIERLIKVADFEKEEVILFNIHNQEFRFKIGNFEGIVMGIICSGDEKVFKVKNK